MTATDLAWLLEELEPESCAAKPAGVQRATPPLAGRLRALGTKLNRPGCRGDLPPRRRPTSRRGTAAAGPPPAPWRIGRPAPSAPASSPSRCWPWSGSTGWRCWTRQRDAEGHSPPARQPSGPRAICPIQKDKSSVNSHCGSDKGPRPAPPQAGRSARPAPQGDHVAGRPPARRRWEGLGCHRRRPPRQAAGAPYGQIGFGAGRGATSGSYVVPARRGVVTRELLLVP